MLDTLKAPLSENSKNTLFKEGPVVELAEKVEDIAQVNDCLKRLKG